MELQGNSGLLSSEKSTFPKTIHPAAVGSIIRSFTYSLIHSFIKHFWDTSSVLGCWHQRISSEG